ncbi:amino acid/polyamine/organocation transporter, APC superfamily [Sulfobacillus thermosulfidooxidans DSM 9293]|uniref:Amino acid/polyamine/organocation transporter, APC superfamily n=1 Tax=Sulfobacillus thermosulfidooxidans (strain DSM 9293 / VKM B-1269 / AT-1) TaxID=929705 RepID=A0A1W1WG98_SULTA|nr:APC family permease [Sulfobacillus thermosulfidooxidans]SMC04743.1 amino acid/polyamine/organocation transporter, APC superfamily [Sulfobacillus thermosulfidooxidans DSM 9293]
MTTRTGLESHSKRFMLGLTLPDLSSLSISSVAPLFSMAAAGQLLVQLAGADVLWAILAVAIPFVFSSWIFRLLNHHFPNAGASYHWSRRVLGTQVSQFQSWILIMAYFWSIPPIIIPAADQSLSLLGIARPDAWDVVGFSLLWIIFAASVLLLGSRMTARVTQIFLLAEVLAVMAMMVIGFGHWHHVILAPSENTADINVRWQRIVIAMVVAATIVDGWEIDSYAAEEATKPRSAPGTGGIIGALMVLAYYGLSWSVMLHNVPLSILRRHPDVLMTWAHMVIPSVHRWALIPILASTAGSLWLTTFILSRALFAMGRDHILPPILTRFNRFNAPIWAIIIPSLAAFVIVCVNLFWTSMTSWFNLVLSSAGFFLVLEFLFDSITASVFLSRQHDSALPHGLDGHQHRFLQLISWLTSLWLLTMTGFFLVYGGQVIGKGIDEVVGILMLAGIIFVMVQRKQAQSQTLFIFEPEAQMMKASSSRQ